MTELGTSDLTRNAGGLSSTTITSIGMSVRWARSDARHASIVFDALNAGTTQVTPAIVVAAASAAMVRLTALFIDEFVPCASLGMRCP